MIELIEPLKERLSTIVELKYVDENWGQLDYYGQNPPVKWPCALVAITSARFSDTGMDRTAQPQNRQMGELLVEIRVANVKLTNTSAMAPVNQKESARGILYLIQAIHELIHGWSPGGNIGKLTRQGMQHERRDDGIQDYSIYYAVAVSDC